MNDKQKAETTALPMESRPEVHRAGRRTAVSLEQDKELREMPEGAESRFDDSRMKDIPSHGKSSSAEKMSSEGSKVADGSD